MALVGGAGNVAGGANPSGTGTTLNYIGDHAYAYSGNVSVTTDETTLLQFTTGAAYIVGTVQVSSSESGNDDLIMLLYLNDEVITGENYSNTFSTTIQGYNEIEILIPSYSKFKGTLDVLGGSSPTVCQMMFKGRVYYA
jgi:hypothetical protein